MNFRLVKIALSALLICGVCTKVFSLDVYELSELANENVNYLMEKISEECIRHEGGCCYTLIVDTDETNALEVEVLKGWINRVEIVE